jgi:hypothetical protein
LEILGERARVRGSDPPPQEVRIEDFLVRIWENLLGRVSGPMRFRLVLQPLVSVIFAIRSGRRDAREGRLPYFWSLFQADTAERLAILRDGLRDQGRVLVVAVALDAVYQAIVLHTFHPGEALIVAAILAVLPYLVARGVVNRVLRRRSG